jgi:hypothetical protein
MQVSVADGEQQAMLVFTVSHPINADLMQQLLAVPAVHKATQINL